MSNTLLMPLLFVLGLIIGSFFNVVIYRLPRGLSISRPPSFCPSCGQSIRFYDNIPVVSYLVLRGACRRCGAKISARYPIIELATALLLVGLSFRFGLTPALGLYFLFTGGLVVASMIDLDTQFIPDLITLPGIGIGLIGSLLVGTVRPIESSVGIAAGAGFFLLVATAYRFLRKREGLGGGDIKLLAMVGAFLGWPALLPTLLIGSISGLVAALASMGLRAGMLKEPLPFGPFLSLGALVTMFFDLGFRL